MEGGTVSVVVPTYYRNDRLQATLESVSTQSYRPVEIVVVDGSGVAHARPVVEEFDCTYIAQESDEGPQAARSVGAEWATGEYVQFLDDDDQLLETKLEVQVSVLEDAEGIGVVYCGLIDEEWGEVRPDDPVRGDALKRTLQLDTFPAIPSTMLIDADVLAEMLPLGNRHGADDSGMKIELARRTQFAYIDEPLVKRGKPDDSLSSSWAHIEGRKRLVEKYEDLYDQFPPEVRRTAMCQTYYRQGRKQLEESYWSVATIVSFAYAAYYTPEDQVDYLGDAIASLFGRPGLRLADWRS